MKKELEPFVSFPRHVSHARRNGDITPNEYDLYMYLRHQANPYGITCANLKALADDYLHRKWNENTVNKMLLSLKRKGFLWYEDRTGRRGSFDVRFPQFKTPDGNVTAIPNEYHEHVSQTAHSESATPAEATQSFPTQPQKLYELQASKDGLVRTLGDTHRRAPYTEIEKETEKTRPCTLKKGTRPQEYEPTSHATERCKEIALALKEETIEPLLTLLREHGLILFEAAWVEYEATDKSKIRESAGAYFTGIVRTMAQRRQATGDV